MATSPFSEASYCKVLVPRPTHNRGRQGVAHDREPVDRAAFRGSDGLEPPKSVTVRDYPFENLSVQCGTTPATPTRPSRGQGQRTPKTNTGWSKCRFLEQLQVISDCALLHFDCFSDNAGHTMYY